MSNLTVLTVVENTGELADLTVSSILKYTHPVPKIIVCNNGKRDKYINSWESNNNIQIIDNKPKMYGGSNRHGDGIQKIFKLVTTPVTAIMDSDTVLLANDWDKFDTGKYDLVALERGSENGKSKSIGYHMCFMLFKTKCFLGMDFRPGNNSTRANGRSYKMHEDVGWMIKKFVNPKRVQLLNFVNLKKNSGVVFDNSFCSVEIHNAGNIIAAHFGRGSNIKGKINRKGFDTSIEQVDKWIRAAREHMR